MVVHIGFSREVRTMNVLSVGESTIDHYTGQGISLVGGISLNFAVHARQCGSEEVTLISRIGTDYDGDRVLSALKMNNVSAEGVTKRPGRTATCEISVGDQGERSYPVGGYRRNVLDSFELSRGDLKMVDQSDILVTMNDHSAPFGFLDSLLRLPYPGRRVVDFGDWSDYGGNWSEILQLGSRLDLLFISGDETAVDVLLPLTAGKGLTAVVTLGQAGSLAMHDGNVYRQCALPVEKVLDTTGCGDAFQAAFTVSFMAREDPGTALLEGACKAREVAGHYGAFLPQ